MPMMSLVDLGKRLLESAKLGETDEVRLLMTNGAPFTTDWLGTSPLHMAAQYGHVATAEVLLRAGISRDARTKVDRTPLHIAAQEGHKDIVELLIKHGAEVNATDMLRMTPLHWAVERNHASVVKYLLNYDADVHAVSKFYKTPLDIAEDNCRTDVLEMLQEYSSNTRKIKSKETYQQKLPLPALPKSPLILPKPQTVIPLNIIKTNSVSTEQLKNIVNRTVKTLESNVNSSVTVATSSSTSAKICYPGKPILLHANLGSFQSSSKNNCSKSSLEEDADDVTSQSCTSVLTTLAALAEATAPNAKAGKLALTWVKEQQNNNISREVTSSAQDISTSVTTISNHIAIPNQKIITIVADQNHAIADHLPSILSTQQEPVVVISSQGPKVDDQPPVKRIKTYCSKKDIRPIVNGKISISPAMDDERSLLQKELEKTRKEAAEYKAQLLIKEHEAELYRKQLEQLKRNS